MTTTVNNNSGNLEIAIDDELALIENAFEYLTKKKYPPGCSNNHKRIIRRKSERLEEQNGEIFYMKLGGSMVSRVNNRLSDTRLNRTPAQQIRETWRRGLSMITYLSPHEACTPVMNIEIPLVLV